MASPGLPSDDAESTSGPSRQQREDEANLRLLSSFIRPDTVSNQNSAAAEGGYLTRETLMRVLLGEFY